MPRGRFRGGFAARKFSQDMGWRCQLLYFAYPEVVCLVHFRLACDYSLTDEERGTICEVCTISGIFSTSNDLSEKLNRVRVGSKLYGSALTADEGEVTDGYGGKHIRARIHCQAIVCSSVTLAFRLSDRSYRIYFQRQASYCGQKDAKK